MQETEAVQESPSKADDPDRAHLADIEDGCGCAEVWEHMSENREE
jgi:hypothetical protein